MGKRRDREKCIAVDSTTARPMPRTPGRPLLSSSLRYRCGAAGVTGDQRWFAASPADPGVPLLNLVPRLPTPASDWRVLDAVECALRFPLAPAEEACFIAQTEWCEGGRPAHLSYWEIGSDPGQYYWLLWRSCLSGQLGQPQGAMALPDGAAITVTTPTRYVWKSQTLAACERANLGVHEAGILLLRFAWQQLLMQYGIQAPDFYDAASLFNTTQLRELACQVWGR